MRRLAQLLLPAAVALAVPAAAAAAPPSVPTAATLDACHASAEPLGRYAVFTAQMGTVPGTARMQVRFDVVNRAAGARRYRALRGPGVGVWRSSAPGIDIFKLHKQVSNLPVGGDVRAVVSFRWVDSSGAVIRRAKLRTAACRQPDQRPDLAIDGLTAQRTDDPTRLRYVLALRNAGVGDAGEFDVAFSVDGAAQPPQAVTALVAGEQRRVSFFAPRCAPGGFVRVRLDPDNRVDEQVEAGNARTFACPAAA